MSTNWAEKRNELESELKKTNLMLELGKALQNAYGNEEVTKEEIQAVVDSVLSKPRPKKTPRIAVIN